MKGFVFHGPGHASWREPAVKEPADAIVKVGVVTARGTLKGDVPEVRGAGPRGGRRNPRGGERGVHRTPRGPGACAPEVVPGGEQHAEAAVPAA